MLACVWSVIISTGNVQFSVTLILTFYRFSLFYDFEFDDVFFIVVTVVREVQIVKR